jgi:hypothetical protein
MRVVNHDATKRFFAEFPTKLVGHLGEDGAPEDAELGGVGHRRRKKSEWDATGEANRSSLGTVAEVHNCAHNARPHEIRDGHAVEHRRCVVPDCAPWAFGFAEHAVGIGGSELYTDAHASTHLTGRSSVQDIVQIKLKTGAKSPN